MKDSGQREGFSTGAVRDIRSGKGRFDLIAPELKQRLALILEAGAEKYGERNWEKGMPLSRIYDSLERHLNQWAAGQDDEDHLGHAACNLMFLIAIEDRVKKHQLPLTLLDLGPASPPYGGWGENEPATGALWSPDESDGWAEIKYGTVTAAYSLELGQKITPKSWIGERLGMVHSGYVSDVSEATEPGSYIKKFDITVTYSPDRQLDAPSAMTAVAASLPKDETCATVLGRSYSMELGEIVAPNSFIGIQLGMRYPGYVSAVNQRNALPGQVRIYDISVVWSPNRKIDPPAALRAPDREEYLSHLKDSRDAYRRDPAEGYFIGDTKGEECE